jgi:hypothetical protein
MEAEQKSKLVDAEREVIQLTTRAEQEQEVAQRAAEQRLSVAQTGLEAAKDQAAALVSEAQAAADVIRFKNTADLAGLKTRVQAFEGDGGSLSENMMIGKLAPAYRTILSNSDGPLMRIFEQFGQPAEAAAGSPGRVMAPAAEPARTTTDTLPDDPFAGPTTTTTAPEAGR